MTENFDVDETLKEYGYGKTRGKAGYIGLSILLLLATIGTVFMGKLWSDEKAKNLQAEVTFKTMSQRLSEMENRNSELSSQLTDKQSELERVRDEWSNQVAELEESHKEQLQRTFAQMNEIVYDSKKTLTYINDIEVRLRKGQKMDQQEAQKLASVVNGLSFLHEQYKKPIAEFRELDRYFQKQLDTIPRSSGGEVIRSTSATATVSRPDPAETTNVLKKIFNNRQFKAEREAYLEEKGRAQGVVEGRVTGRQEGKREALTQAQQVVKQAYARAQAQMNALALDKNKFLAQLDQLVASNNQSAEEVEAFFQQSKEILKIHDQIMNIEPTKVEQLRP
ncbi:MAG: hypothetical protein P1U89_17195 [Verrucomicrobiales bacterium]|nr:hypothetical protein [Verrucomicrobiales bacterium]